MQLIELEDYVAAGEKLASQNPLAYARMAYLSSEDPQVFEEAREISFIDPTNTTPQKDWHFYLSSISRLDTSAAEQLDTFGNRTKTTLSHLSELLIVRSALRLMCALCLPIYKGYGMRCFHWHSQ